MDSVVEDISLSLCNGFSGGGYFCEHGLQVEIGVLALVPKCQISCSANDYQYKHTSKFLLNYGIHCSRKERLLRRDASPWKIEVPLFKRKTQRVLSYSLAAVPMAIIEQVSIWLFVVTVVVIALVWKWAAPRYSGKLPPGPPGIPVLGNLPFLAAAARSKGGRQRALAELALTYGDIMHLQLGRVSAVVVSSVEVAQLFFKKHDAAFSSRLPMAAADILFYGSHDVGFAPYGESWRQSKKLCIVHLLSTRKVESYKEIRESEMDAMVEDLWRSSSHGAMAVDLSTVFRQMPFNVIWRTLAGDTFSDFNKPLMKLVSEISDCIAMPMIGDFIPALSLLDLPVKRRMKRIFSAYDAFLQDLLDRPTKQRSLSDDCFVGYLMNLARKDPSVTPQVIKALILDMFTGGTETLASTLEWTTTLLLKHPACIQRLQQELDHIVGIHRHVQESDIRQMKYLHCVLKESMRLYPVVPLGLMHFSTEEVTVRGFTLPKGTVLMVNYWALHRDPAVWDNPEQFRPERFMNNEKTTVDLSGLSDFTSLPFGAGRRVCPGIPMAISNLLLALAKLFHTFEWMPQGELDMEEAPGNILSRKNPLLALPKLRVHYD